jgi:hypothetical protein
VVGGRAITGSAASANQMGRFETRWLSRPENLAALADLPGRWIDKVHRRRPPRIIVLDMDSSESPTYGKQEGSSYNGHFGCTVIIRCSCSTSLVIWNGARCGPATCTAPMAGEQCWSRWSLATVASSRLYFRGDAAFANPEIYEFLEAERAGYTIRLPANSVLQNRIGYLLKRPVGRPPHDVRRHFASFSYQAELEKAASRRGQGRMAFG